MKFLFTGRTLNYAILKEVVGGRTIALEANLAASLRGKLNDTDAKLQSYLAERHFGYLSVIIINLGRIMRRLSKMS